MLELENLAGKVYMPVPHDKKKLFHEFFRKTTDSISNNVFHDKNDTYKKTKSFRENKNIKLISEDRDSSIIIMNMADFGPTSQKRAVQRSKSIVGLQWQSLRLFHSHKSGKIEV